MGVKGEQSNLKARILLLMGLSVIMCLYGLSSRHWIEWSIYDYGINGRQSSEPIGYGHASLGEMYAEGESVSYSELVTYWCEDEDIGEEGLYGDMIRENCDYFTLMDETGNITFLLLLTSSIIGVFFLMVAYKSIEGEKKNLSLALLDPRFCLSAGGLAILGPLFWGLRLRDSINLYEPDIGASFYITFIGGFLGIVSNSMIVRNLDFTKDKAAATERAIVAEDRSKAERAEAERSDEDQKLLNLAADAVKAKAEAEADPDDPLLWLRMAKAMDAANRPEEAELGRSLAMELMEKRPR